jgi:hypothetical protein
MSAATSNTLPPAASAETPGEQRAVLQTPTPATTLSLGLFSGADAFSGVSATTAEHVSFYARGAASQSDLVAQASGAMWLQSMTNVAGLAAESLMVSSQTMTLFWARGGLTLIAGIAPGEMKPEPSDGTRLPTSVSEYAENTSSAAKVWAIMDAAMAVSVAAAQATLAKVHSRFNPKVAAGMAANVAGASLQIAELAFGEDVTLPAIHLFSQAGTVVGSAQSSVSFFGVAGTLVASPFTQQFGLVYSRVRGVLGASVSAVGTVDLASAGNLAARASKHARLASRGSTLSLAGEKVYVGVQALDDLRQGQSTLGKLVETVGKWLKLGASRDVTEGATYLPALQEPTARATLRATEEARLRGGKVNLSTPNLKGSAGSDIRVRAEEELKIMMRERGTELTFTPAKPVGLRLEKAWAMTIAFAKDEVLATAAETMSGPKPSARFGAGELELASGKGSIKIRPGESITVDGMEFKFV